MQINIIILIGIILGSNISTHANEKRLKSLANQKGVELIYDEKIDEFAFVITKNTANGSKSVKTYPLRFDPFTGGKLTSERDTLFYTEESSPIEYKKLYDTCLVITNREGMVQVFGKPANQQNEANRISYRYDNLSDQFYVFFYEEKKSFSFSIMGKMKQKGKEVTH